MIRKVYFADCVKDGHVCGACWIKVWFWQSPYTAIEKLSDLATAEGFKIAQFRRVR